MPTEWNESHIIKLPKKGDTKECKNYRGISLLTVHMVGKIFNRIMLMRLQTAVDAMLRDQQAGFRKVVHAGKLSDSFALKTGVKQGCLMSPFLFLLAIDWTMKETTDNQQTGIQWNLQKQFDDLDFTDDIVLLYCNNQQMQDKTTRMMENSAKLGLKPNVDKPRSWRLTAHQVSLLKSMIRN